MPGNQDAPLPSIMAVEIAARHRDMTECGLAEAVHASRKQQ